jgi:HlyD family type I secretion membrane fusion protein
MPNTRRPILAGLAIIAVFFIGFGGWAAIAPLDSAAIAPGLVVVDSSRKTVKHLEGGIVTRIFAREGGDVRAGEILLELDGTQARAQTELLRGRHLAALALQARLIAERDEAREIGLPTALRAAKDEPGAAAILDGQSRIFQARAEALSSQASILRQRTEQFREEIVGLTGQIAAQDLQLKLIGEEMATVEDMLAKGQGLKPRLLALKRLAAEIEGSRSQNRAAIARARQSIGEAELQIAQLRTARINEVVKDLRDTESDLYDIAERRRAAEDVLARTVIRAPMDGTVVGLKVHTPGGVIGAGEALMDIVRATTSS